MLEYVVLLLAKSQLTSQNKCPEVKATYNPCSRILHLLSAPMQSYELCIHTCLLQEPVPHATVPTEEDSEELLAGHHDLPAELQDQATAPHQAEQEDGFYIKVEFEKVIRI